MIEPIPPLPELKISELTKKFLDQATVDHAMRIIYERRPDLFTKLADRIKRWQKDKTQNEDDWVHDETVKECQNFIYYEIAKEVNLPNLNARTHILMEAEARAMLMYKMQRN